jgi:hypothetical protein
MPLTRRGKRVLLLAAGVLALAAWFLPSQFNAEPFRARLEAGLTALLNRRATFGSASFQLLPQPRFTLENVMIQEEPAFGAEPFARIDRAECDLRWSSLWDRKVKFSRLILSRPSFNLVRDTQHNWNFESILVHAGVAGRSESSSTSGVSVPFEIEMEEARLDFKEGFNKEPLAVVDLEGQLRFDTAQRRVEFQLRGNPVRTDLPFPAPGLLELAGQWKPGPDMRGVFDATLRTQGALLYNWVPLLTENNHEIYGVLDADIRLKGTLRTLRIEGESTVTQLHRADLVPPAEALPLRANWRVTYELGEDRLAIESAAVTFANSSLHVTGTVEKVRESPDLDLVIALERSQLEDGTRLVRRLWHAPEDMTLSGRVDGLLTVQGRAGERRYGGFVTGRGARLLTSAGTYPLSDISLRLDPKGARLDPVNLTVGPRCVLAVDGTVQPARAADNKGKGAQPPRYEIRAETRNASLREVVQFVRALGVPHIRTTDAQGLANATVLVKGVAWPAARPSISVKGDVRSARLLIPGLTEPLNVPRAHIQVADQRIVIDSITAVIGSSVFTGRVEHSGPRVNPWEFDLKANALSLEQGAAWFDALGHRPALALLERIPGLASLTNRRSVAAGMFNAIHARGRFATPLLTYRALRLQDFETSLDLTDRILNLSEVSFRAGKGRGEGRAQVDLHGAPAEIAGEVKVADVRLEGFADRLPPALRKMRGTLSGVAQFKTRGLSRSEMSTNLGAEGSARLEKVGLGDFDPLVAVVRTAAMGEMDRSRREVSLKPATIAFVVKDRQVVITDQQIEMDAAKFKLNGSWVFNGPLDLSVSADMSDVKRAWMASGGDKAGAAPVAAIHLTGPLREVQAAPGEPPSLASRSKVQ